MAGCRSLRELLVGSPGDRTAAGTDVPELGEVGDLVELRCSTGGIVLDLPGHVEDELGELPLVGLLPGIHHWRLILAPASPRRHHPHHAPEYSEQVFA
jgi:hypothetical protein